MDVSTIGLFTLAEQRLSWLEKRQEVLAGNIANADTPNWQPKDVGAFAGSLARAGAVAPAITHPNHLAGIAGALVGTVAARPSARAPDGNAVSLDTELMKVADTETTQEMVTNLYGKYMSFFRLALGRGQ